MKKVDNSQRLPLYREDYDNAIDRVRFFEREQSAVERAREAGDLVAGESARIFWLSDPVYRIEDRPRVVRPKNDVEHCADELYRQVIKFDQLLAFGRALTQVVEVARGNDRQNVVHCRVLYRVLCKRSVPDFQRVLMKWYGPAGFKALYDYVEGIVDCAVCGLEESTTYDIDIDLQAPAPISNEEKELIIPAGMALAALFISPNQVLQLGERR